MRIERIPVAPIDPALYNPCRNLQPGDPESPNSDGAPMGAAWSNR